MRRINKSTLIYILLFSILLWLTYLTIYSHYNELRFVAFQTNNVKEIGKENITVFIAIFSYISFKDRRDGIRDSWGSLCRNNELAVCKFIIDRIDNFGKEIHLAQKYKVFEESKRYNDITLMDSYAGKNFLYRLYRTLIWASERYNFDYFVRIDDDHYLCFERLMFELPRRKHNRNMYWGYQHCYQGGVRMDPSLLIMSEDLIRYFMGRKETLRCTTFEGIGVSIWVHERMEEEAITWFADERIYEKQVKNFLQEFLHRKEICHEYLSLHGTYVKEMPLMHEIFLKEKQSNLAAYKIPTTDVNTCPYDLNKYLNHAALLCIDPPETTEQKLYVGREGRTEK